MMGLEQIKEANRNPEKYYREGMSDGSECRDPPKRNLRRDNVAEEEPRPGDRTSRRHT